MSEPSPIPPGEGNTCTCEQPDMRWVLPQQLFQCQKCNRPVQVYAAPGGRCQECGMSIPLNQSSCPRGCPPSGPDMAPEDAENGSGAELWRGGPTRSDMEENPAEAAFTVVRHSAEVLCSELYGTGVPVGQSDLDILCDLLTSRPILVAVLRSWHRGEFASGDSDSPPGAPR